MRSLPPRRCFIRYRTRTLHWKSHTGRGGYLAVQNQIYTKLGTGSLVPSQIAMQTYGKMYVATGVKQAPGAAVQGVLSNLASVLRQLNSILSRAFSGLTESGGIPFQDKS